MGEKRGGGNGVRATCKAGNVPNNAGAMRVLKGGCLVQGEQFVTVGAQEKSALVFKLPVVNLNATN
jgi:hypothetical protein